MLLIASLRERPPFDEMAQILRRHGPSSWPAGSISRP